MFQKVSDLTYATYRKGHHQICTAMCHSFIHSLSVRPRIRKWKYVTVGEMYVVTALFIFMGILQEHPERSHYNKNCLLYSLFSLETFLKDGAGNKNSAFN